MPVRLFVGNLPYAAQEADIRRHFAAVGEPSQILIPIDRTTGRVRGFAFVDFDDPAVAANAVRQLDGQPFMGRPLAVSEARPRGERPPGSRPPREEPPPRPGGGAGPTGDWSPGGDRLGERRARQFGPPKPARQRGPGASRRHEVERPAKRPIRERMSGRVFDIDEEGPGAEFDDRLTDLEGAADLDGAPPPDDGAPPPDDEEE